MMQRERETGENVRARREVAKQYNCHRRSNLFEGLKPRLLPLFSGRDAARHDLPYGYSWPIRGGQNVFSIGSFRKKSPTVETGAEKYLLLLRSETKNV